MFAESKLRIDLAKRFSAHRQGLKPGQCVTMARMGWSSIHRMGWSSMEPVSPREATAHFRTLSQEFLVMSTVL